MRVLNDPRPWWGTLRGRELTILDLLRNETLAAREVALVWWALDHGASLFVAAGPQGAGKSTLAHAFLPFLPSDAQVYVTAGAWDQLNLPHPANGTTFLLINELSWHLPYYLHGPPAPRAFELLRSGVRMVGTLHARSVREAVDVMCQEAGIDPSFLVQPILVVIVRAVRDRYNVSRRVDEIGLIVPQGASVGIAEIGRFDTANQRFELVEGGLDVLARLAHTDPMAVAADIKALTELVDDWARRTDLRSSADVEQAVQQRV